MFWKKKKNLWLTVHLIRKESRAATTFNWPHLIDEDQYPIIRGWLFEFYSKDFEVMTLYSEV